MKPTPEALAQALADCEALVTRSSTAVTAALLDRAPRLRIVGRAGVGVDNIDIDACSRRGVVVVNAPHGNVVSAAEHTLGMLLALVRRLPEAHARLKTLEWDRSIYAAELYRKTIGVVGLGKAGSRVARRPRGGEPARLRAGAPARLRSIHPGSPRARSRRPARAGLRHAASRGRHRHVSRASDARDRRDGRGPRAGAAATGSAYRELRARRHRR